MNLEGKVWGYNKRTIVIVGYTIVIIAAGFFIGGKYEKSKLSSMGLLKNSKTVVAAPAKKAKASSSTSSNTNNSAADTISGSITAKDAKSITIKTVGNISQLILVSSSTTIDQSGTLADLIVGEQVEVKGTKNADGSFSASDVQKAAVTTAQ